MADFAAAPLRVSPLIRFGRWGLLSAGIMYGMFHQGRLSRKEASLREIESKQKAIRDEKLAIEKKLASEREIHELESLAGITHK